MWWVSREHTPACGAGGDSGDGSKGKGIVGSVKDLMGGGGNSGGGLKGAIKDLTGGPKSEGIGGLSGGPESQVAPVAA